MVVIHGTRPFGKCDVVPELFYVATWFWHIDYLPLIPLGSKLVLSQRGDQYHVVSIPVSLKSIAYAWMRAALLVGGIIAWIIALVALNDPQMGRELGAVWPLGAALGCSLAFVLVMVYPRRKMPSYKRAAQLAQIAQFTDRGWAALNVLYGRDPQERPGQTDVLRVDGRS